MEIWPSRKKKGSWNTSIVYFTDLRTLRKYFVFFRVLDYMYCIISNIFLACETRIGVELPSQRALWNASKSWRINRTVDHKIKGTREREDRVVVFTQAAYTVRTTGMWIAEIPLNKNNLKLEKKNCVFF